MAHHPVVILSIVSGHIVSTLGLERQQPRLSPFKCGKNCRYYATISASDA